MDITCDQSCGMGYIYLQQFKQHQKEDFDKSRLIASAQPIEVIDNIYLKLNKLNWPDKKYIDALMDGNFIEEFQNDFDENAYLKGIELQLNQKRLESIIEHYKLATFEFNKNQFYYIAFAEDEKVFDSKNYVYPLSDKEDAFVIITRSQERRYQITLGENKESEKSLSPKIAYIRALIFKEESPYDIDYLKRLKLYISNEDY
ncbi:hypothetical protein [Halanaerobium congolense]|jgi:hypothetical protein|uniref:Uncharacterized protein n=1 Tax=Halanaerobium congolense TaxID=54121 RepID=A0A1G6PVQ5_9FIRM|nr:hypothetical protein [Halanaerobium congolense]PXV67635.1 hypothetical protein C8C78_10771 [Halanaerobium congolense]TDS32945.1 hypothetical protein BY453_10686 [Halanaerobium congolense]SDC83606.1 hypothetical protein SAMN04488597_11568 [Halanaerobium congolense]SDK92579.1 hypothetical protein SAMN04515655_1286 [Halanaerobium congolense]SDM83120.1 hypothetical protein SAMN04488599_1276 [Halanaerobium congolense]